MFRTTSCVALATTSLLLLGCDAETIDAHDELPTTSLRTTAEEQGLLDFLNDYEVSTEDVLDDDCAIRSDSAKHIDRFRTGHDKTYGTADDQIIDSEATLDSIQMVGPWTIEQLYICAEDFGYITPVCEQPGPSQVVYGSGDDWEENLPAALVDEIEAYWGLDWLCNVIYAGGGTSYLDSVTVSYVDCEVVTYTVVWVRPFDGAMQEILTHYYDADLDLFDGSCEI